MIRATNPYLVPAVDQTADRFTVPLSSALLVVMIPIHTNPVTVLRSLAVWLNFPGAKGATKEALIAGIEQNLSLLPMSDAVARWSRLNLSPFTMSSTELMRKELDVFRTPSSYFTLTLRHETPEFIPHLHVKIAELDSILHTIYMKEDREHTREIEKYHQPNWWMDALKEAPTGPHYKFTIAEFEQEYDDDCTDTDDEKFTKTGQYNLYLHVADWNTEDLREKTEWKEPTSCCGVEKMIQVSAWELVK